MIYEFSGMKIDMDQSIIGAETRSYLDSIGFPGRDSLSLPTSSATFDAGGNYGIEISSINNIDILRRTLNYLDKYSISADRFDECRGIFRLSDEEIAEMANICADRQIGLVMSVGPRAIYDIGGFSKTTNGSRVGYRLRGMENIVRAIEDVKRAVDLGIRGILIYDEGLLSVLNSMRSDGKLPSDIFFKLSVHCGVSNPISCLLFEKTGADTVNIIPDFDLPMISSIRETVNIPIDIFTDTAAEAGGFIRTYDAPEFVRIASPVFLKCGPVSQPRQNHLPQEEELHERVRQTKRVIESIEKYLPTASRVSKNERALCIPKI